MRTNLPLIHFSNIFDAVLKENKLINDKFTPSILFLAGKNGEGKSTREIGNVPIEMIDFYRQFTSYDESYSDNNYLAVTVDVAIHYNNEMWDSVLVAVIDKKKTSSDLLAQSYLEGLKQTFTIASQMVETEKKLSRISKENIIHTKVRDMQKKMGYTEDVQFFSEAFLDLMMEYDMGEEITIFWQDRLRSTFIHTASTEPITVEDKEVHKIAEKKVENLLERRNEKRSDLFQKEDIPELLLKNQKDYQDYFIIPIFSEKDCVGLIIVMNKQGLCNIESIEEVVTLTGFLEPWIGKIIEYEEMQIEKIRKNLLLKVNRKFYSTMDVNSVLEEILHALDEAYPTFKVNLLLTHDWEVADYLPVQPLEIADSEEDPGSKAYLTGDVQVIDSVESHKTILYVPLKGKQGVYGILKMITASSQIFPRSELDFIEILASTGGNAIENAELYQQSRQNIQDLQLINQTSHQLNSNLKLEESITFMISQMKEAFSADEVGFIMLDQRWTKDYESIIWSDYSFQEEKRKLFINGLLTRMKEDKEEIFLGDWSREHKCVPFKSVMGVPMIHNDQVIGAVLVFGLNSYAFSFDSFKLCQSLVHHSSLAFVNAILHEEMKKLVVTDYLTKLFSREYMDEKVAESMNIDGYGSFILLDIDLFKGINDQYGHQTGDHVLIQVAEIIQENIKEMTDIAVRWGGEELAVYLPKTECINAVKVAEKIREEVENHTQPNVTVSCGVSEWSHLEGGASLTKLFSDADKAMYRAKNSGRNRVISFKEAMELPIQ